MVKLSYIIAVDRTNRIILVHPGSCEKQRGQMGKDGTGTVRDVIEPAVSIKKITKELIFMFHGLARQNEKICLLKRHVSPLGKCPVCQMTSPALFLRTAFMEYRVKKSRQSNDKSRPQFDRSGDHTERISRSLYN